MRLFFFSCIVLISTPMFGQGKLEFENTIHDFGDIKEVEEEVEYTFLFVNSGDQPLRISHVKASCGCIASFWTKEEILPGDSGRVTALYNVMNRPGAFTKSLRVISTASNANISLFIKGLVEQKSRIPQDDLPAKYGAIRMKYRSFTIGKITTEKEVTKNFDVYNDSDNVLLFNMDSIVSPDYLTLTFEPEQLQPREKGIIKITYNPIKKGELGYLTDEIIFRTNETSSSVKRLFVIATIEEYFPPMTEKELELAPKLIIKKKSHDFGKVAKDVVLEFEFILANDGENELIVRSTKGNCDCIISTLDKGKIMSGEKVKMKVTFNTKNRKGKQFKSITIFSNDPMNPTQIVTIKAQIGG